ncbi:hypothetical protein [Natrarchaeobius chitinivorans]|nr:hypothetical protein [Natrarchaeobius chitinivorans]
MTLTLTRSGAFTPAKHLGEKLRGADSDPQTDEMRRVLVAVFADVGGIVEQDDNHTLSVTNTTFVALCRRHDLDAT